MNENRISMKIEYGDLMLAYVFGGRTVEQTLRNVAFAEEFVTDPEIKKQMSSFFLRLRFGMPEEKWLQFYRKCRRNIGVMLDWDRQKWNRNFAQLRETARRMKSTGGVYEPV